MTLIMLLLCVGPVVTILMCVIISLGLTIKGVAKAAGAFINHPQIKVSISKKGRLLFPTAIGLTTIPFIIEVSLCTLLCFLCGLCGLLTYVPLLDTPQPIDHLVDIIMDRTYRAYFSPK